MFFKQPLVKAGIISGIGLGGFFDGIVLHQLLQWHHMVCITEHCTPVSVAHLQQQNFQDGLFHAFALAVTVTGTSMLFKAANISDVKNKWLTFWGAILMGFGIFNFVEGLIDHQILGIHHVLPGRPVEFLADMIFLASGVILFLSGWLMVKKDLAKNRGGT